MSCIQKGPEFWVNRTAHAIVYQGYDSLSINEEAALQHNHRFREAVMQRVKELEGKKRHTGRPEVTLPAQKRATPLTTQLTLGGERCCL